jgi:hypothetical protein
VGISPFVVGRPELFGYAIGSMILGAGWALVGEWSRQW